MSFFDSIASAIPGVGMIEGIANTIGGFVSADQNYRNQQAQLAYQKDVQQTTWNREDNAVQRRVADLKAAGLNPVLAAGSAASSSAPIQVTAPQYQYPGSDNASKVLALISAKQNIANTVAQNQLIKKQIESVQKGIQVADVEARTKEWDLSKYRNMNIPSTSSPEMKDMTPIIEMIQGGPLGSAVGGLFGKILRFGTKLLPGVGNLLKYLPK